MQDTPSLDLNPLFHPKTVAVVGASENPAKLGWHVMTSLTRGGFAGRIVPVNPGAEQVLGCRAVANLEEVEGRVDLVVIVVPAGLVSEVFNACIRKGVGGIVLITAGFKEIDDPEGDRVQAALAEQIAAAGIPVVGPNTFGLVDRHWGLNASFTPEFSLCERGGVALVSQSGGISHLSAFVAMREGLGMSKIVGLGNRLNAGFADMVNYLMDDPDTRAIALYIEGLERPRSLLEATLAHRGKKPIVAYKTGSSSSGNRASVSHTGSMAGRHEIYRGFFRQAGILRVSDTEELLDAARALAGAPLPQGGRVAILTGQAGPGMAACDVCEAQGLEVPPFRPATQEVVERLLPPLALRSNPVDMGPAWYDSEAIAEMMRAVLEDEGIDGVLLLMMFASANRAAVSGLTPFLETWGQKKPVISCLLAPSGIWDDEIHALERSGSLVNFPTPERAARALAALHRAAGLKRRFQ
ncbi:MAG: CoA-binding protein [Desulfobacteraceae bacterium]|jgi:acyl-CoA synthetase (NDP forming)